jgi:hypothetical protein
MEMNLNRLVTLAASILIALMILGCVMVESMGEMNEQTEKASAAIEKAVGTKPQIGWNIHNNKLVEVNVYFDQLSDESITVAELKEKIRPLVSANIEQEPQQLLISINIAN